MSRHIHHDEGIVSYVASSEIIVNSPKIHLKVDFPSLHQLFMTCWCRFNCSSFKSTIMSCVVETYKNWDQREEFSYNNPHRS